jgi:UDP-galactose transporter
MSKRIISSDGRDVEEAGDLKGHEPRPLLWHDDRLKLTALFLMLTAMTSSQTLFAKFSRKSEADASDPYRYDPLVMVFVTECVKLTTSVGLFVWNHCPHIMLDSVLHVSTLKFFVPAIIYMSQNALSYYAFALMSPSSYQVLNQLKIVSTALASWLILKREISQTRWCSIALLCLGAMTALLTCDHQNIISVSPTGLTISVILSLLSAAGGISSEYLLKSAEVEDDDEDAPENSIYVKNAKLYLCGAAVSGAAILVKMPTMQARGGVFVGFDSALAWALVSVAAYTGLIVSAMLKHGSALLKTVANVAALCLTAVASSVLFDAPITVMLIDGVAMVSLGLFLYRS